ncbi:hypothetical protein Acr_00g0030680 [Actinidia rufa]|uniref:DUF4283 domain-containing protein n=1 Tax=Actinidia rufa TaxID=165716 RepID=A0A7J0DFE2_9ERIC|nr:hypothetical protein Acr_00g0030680 [Actinidia rufa]
MLLVVLLEVQLLWSTAYNLFSFLAASVLDSSPFPNFSWICKQVSDLTVHRFRNLGLLLFLCAFPKWEKVRVKAEMGARAQKKLEDASHTRGEEDSNCTPSARPSAQEEAAIEQSEPSESGEDRAVVKPALEAKRGLFASLFAGYFGGRFPGKHALKQIVETWKIPVTTHHHNSGWIIFQFESTDAQSNVLENGPYIIYGRPLSLKTMPQFFRYEKEAISSFLIWIQLCNLPLVLWSPSILSKICSQIDFQATEVQDTSPVTGQGAQQEWVIKQSKENRKSVEAQAGAQVTSSDQKPATDLNQAQASGSGDKAVQDPETRPDQTIETANKKSTTAIPAATKNQGRPQAAAVSSSSMIVPNAKGKENVGGKGRKTGRLKLRMIWLSFVQRWGEKQGGSYGHPRNKAKEAEYQGYSSEKVQELILDPHVPSSPGPIIRYGVSLIEPRLLTNGLKKGGWLWKILDSQANSQITPHKALLCSKFKPCRKIKALKGPLKALNRLYFSPISSRAAAAEEDLLIAQQLFHDNPRDASIQIQIADLTEKAIGLAEEEMNFCSQLAKVKYLKNCDKCSKFFHSLIKNNRARNQIVSLTKPDGEATTSFQQDEQAASLIRPVPDDLILFVRGDSTSVGLIFDCLKNFGECSGLCISPNKSNLSMDGFCREDAEEIKTISRFSLGRFPFRYLGIPVAASRLSIEQFSPLISKIAEYINACACATLSYAGRCELIRSVLQGVECFWLSILPIPMGVRNKIPPYVETFYGVVMLWFSKILW